jgi:hypothetical protein
MMCCVAPGRWDILILVRGTVAGKNSVKPFTAWRKPKKDTEKILPGILTLLAKVVLS